MAQQQKISWLTRQADKLASTVVAFLQAHFRRPTTDRRFCVS